MSEDASLTQAVEAGDAEQLRTLLAQGGNANQPDPYGATPLHWAAFRGQSEICELLLEHGADANAASNGGRTPLHLAAQGGNTDVVDLLIARHADVAAVDRAESRTPLHMAVQEGHLEAANLLIACGSDVNQRDAFGQTPLWLAAQSGHTDMVQALLAVGADINIGNHQGVSPLLAALLQGHVEIAQGLVGMGADVRIQDEAEGLFPLHVAALNGFTDMVRLLLEHGAEVTARAKDGSTAEDVAVGAGHAHVAQQLREFGTSPAKQGGAGDGGSATLRLVQGDQPERADDGALMQSREDTWQTEEGDELPPAETADLAASAGEEVEPCNDVAESPVGVEATPSTAEAPPTSRAARPWNQLRPRHLLAGAAGLAALIAAGLAFAPLGPNQSRLGQGLFEQSVSVAAPALQAARNQIATAVSVSGNWLSDFRQTLRGMRSRAPAEPPASEPPSGEQQPAAPPAEAQMFSLKGSINDFASVLDSRTIDYVDSLIQRVRRRAGAEFVVATVDSTQPLSAAAYADKLLDSSEVGKAVKEKGALFLVAVRDGNAAVVAAPSLVGPLWKIRSAEVTAELVRPRLRKGDYAGAVRAGAEEMTSVLVLESTLTVVRGRRVAQKAARDTTTVTIRSRPAGATATLDGDSRQRITPFVVSLRPGTYQLQLTKPGYRNRTETLSVGVGTSEHAFHLQPVR